MPPFYATNEVSTTYCLTGRDPPLQREMTQAGCKALAGLVLRLARYMVAADEAHIVIRKRKLYPRAALTVRLD